MYGVREVEKLLRMPRSTIASFVRAGFVAPTRGPRNALRFSFQDLIVLRTAQALASARVSTRRMTKSLKELRRRLPESMPLSGLSIGAVGDRVVVREGASRWQADSGQYVLAFEGDPAAGGMKVTESLIERSEPLEDGYDLHQAGRLKEAEAAYRRVLEDGDDPLTRYNLGVLLEDLGRKAEAMDMYRAALRGDPRMADCHYNLALLLEAAGRPRDAIRHMAQYRRLAGRK